MTTPTDTRPKHQQQLAPSARSSIVVSSLWMIGLTVALFFLPLVNGLIGGWVGGYKVGSPGRAVVAAILPAAVVAVALWVLLAVLDAPVIGFIAGLTGAVLIVLADVGIFIGALIGGAMSRRAA